MHPQKTLAVLAVVAVCASPARAAPRPVNISNTWVLPEAGFPVFYRYFRDRISWYEADAVCQFHHGNLVTVDTSSQFDAVRTYLKELNIVSNVWIGLTKANENSEFVWSNSKSLTGDGFWGEATPSVSIPLCAATDPSSDFRWHALGCGGPEVAAFVCELPVPPWASGAEGCILPTLPSLTIIYLPEQTAVELTADCGAEGTRRIACKGKADQKEMMRQLSCPQSYKNSVHKTVSSTPYSTHTIKAAATKPWIWTSNTIDTGDFGSPTRHRRETEDMLSTAGGYTITKETSTSFPQEPKVEMKTIKSATTVEYTTKGNGKPDKVVTVTTTAPKIKMEELKKIRLTTEETITSSQPEIEAGEYPSINQGQLFSLIENGTVFDIIEVNDTASDMPTTPDKSKDKKIIDETTTKVTLTSNTELKKEITTHKTHKPGTENPVFTTVSYFKEAPPSKTSQAPITLVRLPTIETRQIEDNQQQARMELNHNINQSTRQFEDEKPTSQSKPIDRQVDASQSKGQFEASKTTSQFDDKPVSSSKPIVKPSQTPAIQSKPTMSPDPPIGSTIASQVITPSQSNLSNGEQDKTFIKAIESGGSLVKLNRTSRKELPMIDFNITSDEVKSDLEGESKEDEKHGHRVVEITLMHDDKKKEGAKLYVTTKKHDKLKMISKNEKAKLLEMGKKKKGDFEVDSKVRIPTEVKEMLATNTTEVKIDPKLHDLNSNTTTNKEAERIPIKLQLQPTEVPENTEYDEEAYKTTDESNRSTDEPLEPIPEAQPRPNRNRVLTRPQRRSFYPYFFSRVLG